MRQILGLKVAMTVIEKPYLVHGLKLGVLDVRVLWSFNCGTVLQWVVLHVGLVGLHFHLI